MMPSNEVIRLKREVIVARAREELKVPPGIYHPLMKLAEIKQKEVLLRFFYIPFWKACTATLLLLIVILFLSGAWIFSSGLIFVCGFSIYVARRSHKHLKRIELQLSKSKMMEITMESVPPEESAASPQNLGEERKE